MSGQYARCWGCWKPLYGGAVFCRKCREQERKDVWALMLVAGALWGGLMFWVFIA